MSDTIKHRKHPWRQKTKRIPTMLECAGDGYHTKIDVNARTNPRRWGPSSARDKTEGQHSRVGAKATLRNANRCLTKRARQIMKRNLEKEL